MLEHTALTWLCLDDPADLAIYETLWQNGRHRRPHDHPAYLALVRPEHCTPHVAVYRHSDAASIAYPCFLTELAGLPAFRHIGRPLRHLTSPYGYGGPIFDGDP